MGFEWNRDLDTGNAVVDSQHKQIVTAFNNLIYACEGGKGRDDVDIILNFLIRYTRQHFADEERLQIKHAYPEYEMHKSQHDLLRNKVLELEQLYKQKGATAVLLAQVVTALGDWIIDHIMDSDKKMAQYIKQKEDAGH